MMCTVNQSDSIQIRAHCRHENIARFYQLPRSAWSVRTLVLIDRYD